MCAVDVRALREAGAVPERHAHVRRRVRHLVQREGTVPDSSRCTRRWPVGVGGWGVLGLGARASRAGEANLYEYVWSGVEWSGVDGVECCARSNSWTCSAATRRSTRCYSPATCSTSASKPTS